MKKSMWEITEGIKIQRRQQNIYEIKKKRQIPENTNSGYHQATKDEWKSKKEIP